MSFLLEVMSFHLCHFTSLDELHLVFLVVQVCGQWIILVFIHLKMFFISHSLWWTEPEVTPSDPHLLVFMTLWTAPPPLPLECGRDLWLASNLIEYGKGDGLPLPWLCYIVKDSALLADLEVLIHFLALSKQAARARNCRQHLVEDGLILQTLRNEFCHQPKWVWKRIHCC